MFLKDIAWVLSSLKLQNRFPKSFVNVNHHIMGRYVTKKNRECYCHDREVTMSKNCRFTFACRYTRLSIIVVCQRYQIPKLIGEHDIIN